MGVEGGRELGTWFSLTGQNRIGVFINDNARDRASDPSNTPIHSSIASPPLYCMHLLPPSSRHLPPLPQQLLPPPQRRRLTHHDVLLHCSSIGSAILELLRRPRAPPPRLKRLRMRGAAGGGRAAAAHRCGGTLVGAAHSKRTNYLTARTQGRARLR